jgi:hypothetical protein
MAIIVRPTTRSSISVSGGSGVAGSITVNKSTGGTLQSLSNVVTTDLQDGYTLIYDTATNKWVAQPVTAGVAAVDGGTY